MRVSNNFGTTVPVGIDFPSLAAVEASRHEWRTDLNPA
jgi:hypothetical protein